MTTGALDPDVVGQLRDDLPPDVFATIVATFEADAERLSDQLSRAAAAEDATAFRRAAHTLAGAAAAVGAVELEATARRGMAADAGAAQAAIHAAARAQVASALAELNELCGR